MKSFELSVKDIGDIALFPICSEMSSEDVKIFVRHLAGVEYPPGEIIFEQENKENDHLFIILDGEVKITSTLHDFGDSSLTVNIQKSGDVAGILSFIDGRGHKASAEAVSPVRAAIVSRKDYQHFKDYHPGIAAIMLQYLIVSADDLACQLLQKLSESQAYMHGIMSGNGKR